MEVFGIQFLGQRSCHEIHLRNNITIIKGDTLDDSNIVVNWILSGTIIYSSSGFVCTENSLKYAKEIIIFQLDGDEF